MPGIASSRRPTPISPFRRRGRRNGEIGGETAPTRCPRHKCLGYEKVEVVLAPILDTLPPSGFG